MSDVVGRITGNFGIWQLRAVLCIYLCKIPASWFMACVIFTAPAPKMGEFFCITETINKTLVSTLSTSTWVNIAHPKLQQDSNDSLNTKDFCHIFRDVEKRTEDYFKFNGSIPDRNSNITNCKNFQYESTYHSLVHQFDLICDREILVAWTQFWHLFGVLCGGIIATRLMDYFSPKKIFLFGISSQIIFGCLTGLVDNFNAHCFFRCIAAICCAQMFTSGQTIFSDITGGKYRIACNNLFDQFWSIGVILLPGISSLFQNWVHIYLAISLPTFCMFIFYQWIPDAPRWLLRHGRITEAENILLECAKINDREYILPENFEQELRIQAENLQLNDNEAAGWFECCRRSSRRRTFLNFVMAHIAWAVFVTNFNGMLLNIRSFGRDYLSVNTIVTGVAEIVGCFMALHLCLKTEYKWQWAGIFNILAGLIGCFGWLIPHSLEADIEVTLWMLLNSIPKIGVSISQSMLIACTGELVTPSKRPIFIFSCIVFARICLLTAPFINVLKNIDTAASLSFFSILGILGGIATCCLSSTPFDSIIPTTAVGKSFKVAKAHDGSARHQGLHHSGWKNVLKQPHNTEASIYAIHSSEHYIQKTKL